MAGEEWALRASTSGLNCSFGLIVGSIGTPNPLRTCFGLPIISADGVGSLLIFFFFVFSFFMILPPPRNLRYLRLFASATSTIIKNMGLGINSSLPIHSNSSYDSSEIRSQLQLMRFRAYCFFFFFYLWSFTSLCHLHKGGCFYRLDTGHQSNTAINAMR